MSEQVDSKISARITYPGVGMALGLILGALVGLAVDNMIIFAGGTMVLGLAIGLALEKRRLG